MMLDAQFHVFSTKLWNVRRCSSCVQRVWRDTGKASATPTAVELRCHKVPTLSWQQGHLGSLWSRDSSHHPRGSLRAGVPVVPIGRKSGSAMATLGVQPWSVQLGTLPSLRVLLPSPPWEPLILHHPPSSSPPVNPAPSPLPCPRSPSSAAPHTAMPWPDPLLSAPPRPPAQHTPGDTRCCQMVWPVQPASCGEEHGEERGEERGEEQHGEERGEECGEERGDLQPGSTPGKRRYLFPPPCPQLRRS